MAVWRPIFCLSRGSNAGQWTLPKQTFCQETRGTAVSCLCCRRSSVFAFWFSPLPRYMLGSHGRGHTHTHTQRKRERGWVSGINGISTGSFWKPENSYKIPNRQLWSKLPNRYIDMKLLKLRKKSNECRPSEHSWESLCGDSQLSVSRGGGRGGREGVVARLGVSLDNKCEPHKLYDLRAAAASDERKREATHTHTHMYVRTYISNISHCHSQWAVSLTPAWQICEVLRKGILTGKAKCWVKKLGGESVLFVAAKLIKL